MIDSENLRTASLYINNQLLSRGLLRDGQNIDFVSPGDDASEVAATMGRIMAVVNDLILRRDRDAEHRESLATTLRTLRAENLRQANDVQRLQEKFAEAQRKLSISEAAEASLRTQLRSAEASVHRLKEEAARQKTLVNQTRAACANEVRKRDRQIDGLKKAISEAGRTRGAGKGTGVTTINVVGDVNVNNRLDDTREIEGDYSAEGGYDLRQETNAFLAELAKGLSEENETLLDLVRRTTNQLKEMSGYDSGGGHVKKEEEEEGEAIALPTDPAEMSSEITAILDHLRVILTNPSFVPIEEVVVREDEINRLRDGWEKMESRWKEAVHLIDGWRRRMQVSGRAVNVEELKMGLRLSPVRVQHVEETAQAFGVRPPPPPPPPHLAAVAEETAEEEEEQQQQHGVKEEEEEEEEAELAESLHLVPAESGNGGLELEDLDEIGYDSDIYEDEDAFDDIDVNALDVDEPNVEILEQSILLDSPPLPRRPELTPLRDNHSAGNRGQPVRPLNYGRPRPDERERFATIAEENTTWDNLRKDDEPPLPPPHAHLQPVCSQQSPKKKPSSQTLQQQQPPIRPVVQIQEDTTVPTPAAAPPAEGLNESTSSLDDALLVKVQPHQEDTNTTAKTSSSVTSVVSTGTTTASRERISPTTSTKQPQVKQERKSKPNTKPPVPPRSNITTRTTRKPVSRPGSRQDENNNNESSSTTSTKRTISSGTTSNSTTTGTSTATTATRTVSGSSDTHTHTTSSGKGSSGDMLPPPLPSPNRSPKRVNSRLPLPRLAPVGGGGSNVLPQPVQSPLTMATIAAKLAASERDADAARVRAKLRAARLGKKQKRMSLAPVAVAKSSSSSEVDVNARSTRSEGDEKNDDDDVQQQQPPPRKRERRGGGGDGDKVAIAANRRRSTLNPWELETLIQGNVQVPVPAVPGNVGEGHN
ncbi:Afadin and alpha-actinin-binding-domain-containing protein [Diplogelasinospora grovesii]|uniref:Afadin and alpha-actinin-binding-domain-containing protein n=1 Tax=Diplogelasinospora grovesii TaxID=303347 RepID=A0AAN6NIM2_9PEZI|nr:Afadin and alpha-actinin-binding-domain-containing protein [Diplogelasinospora grovesii]